MQSFFVIRNLFGIKPYLELSKKDRLFNCKYLSSVEKIMFEITDDNENSLKTLTKDKKLLLNLIIKILNKVLKSFRIFGWAWHIHKYNPKHEMDISQLIFLQVKVSEDGKNYISFINEFSTTKTFSSFQEYAKRNCEEFSHLSISKLPKIEEAISDKNIDILKEEEPAETEFLVNSREYLENKNFRFAIIESVIALEIALTRYIRVYFMHIKNYSKKKIEKFLNANFNLSTRLYIIPTLTLNDNDYTKIDFDLVLRAVGLRNKIIHREEDCLSGASEDDIVKYVSEIIKLSRLLSLKILQIKTKPEMQNIAEKIKNKFSVNCNIKRLRNHRFNVEIYYTFSSDDVFFKKKNKVIQIINILSKSIIKYDNIFKANEHLIVYFYDIYDKKLWAYWNNEKFVNLSQ